MRKFTRILTLVMVACLLCGVVATTISAEASTSILDITDPDSGIKTLGYTGSNSSGTTGMTLHNTIADTMNNNKSKYAFYGNRISNGFTQSKTTVDGYTYVEFKHKGTAASSTKSGENTQWWFAVNYGASGENYRNMLDYYEYDANANTAYSVYDFELTTFEYRFKFTGDDPDSPNKDESSRGYYRAASEILEDKN